MSLRDLSELSAPTPGLPTTSLVNTFGDDIDQAVTFHVNALDGLYDSGECVVLFFEAEKVPEVFAGDYGDIEEALLDHLDAFLASEKPVDLPFTGRKVDRAELGVEVPEDLMQANVVSLESLRKVASLGLDCDLVLYDDEFWAFKYSTGSEYIEQIRRLDDSSDLAPPVLRILSPYMQSYSTRTTIFEASSRHTRPEAPWCSFTRLASRLPRSKARRRRTRCWKRLWSKSGVGNGSNHPTRPPFGMIPLGSLGRLSWRRL